jgi:RNA polymerase sigma-70 factor, ECF subfamily
MQNAKPEEEREVSETLKQAAAGDEEALRALFAAHRDRLKRMVHLRLNRRLASRVDDSDVLQEAFVEVARKLPEYAYDPKSPLFLWMRHLTALKLAEFHLRHLGTQLRDADREVTLHRGGLPLADSVSLAAHLLGTLTTPSQAAIKAETRPMVQEALNGMHPIDREVLALRHFEQLSTTEIAEVLGLSKAGAGSRYLRAIKRVRTILEQIPGFEAF